MKFENLSNEDIQLIKSTMISHSVTILADCQECKTVMPKESYDRDMKQSERLIYLVNVLNDTKEYDSNKGSITNEELDECAKFTDHEKKIIKEAYANNPKGTFPNPRCALY